MSILQYFKPSSSLPTPSETGIGDIATDEENAAVQKELDRQSCKSSKVYTTFSDKTRAEIGRYAAENGNAAALRKFHSDIPDLGESMVRLFKKRYHKELRKAPHGTSLSIMKELWAKGIVSAYDYLRCNPSISMNGFKEAGILDTMEGKIISVGSFPLDDEDPFADLTDDDSH